MLIYQILDVFFIVLHTILTLFGLTGWIWKKSRKIHLGYMLLTALSWFGLGIFFGLGYCFLTDLHWQVKIALGQTDIPRSYVKYVLDLFTGLDFNAMLVDTVVMVCFLASVILTIALNVRDVTTDARLK